MVSGQAEKCVFKFSYFLIGVVCLLFGFVAAKISDISLLSSGHSRESRRVSGFRYINPLLECDQADQWLTSEFRPSLEATEAIIDKHKKLGDVVTAAVYFRDLNNGPWFGVEEKQPFAASSMLKIAHLIAVYKQAEKNPSLLGRHVRYEKILHTEAQTITPDEKLVLGTEYTVEDLVHRMIVYSDNEALYLLQAQVPESATENVYADLGMEFTADNEITVRNYSTLFRVLFNASYLNYDNSELALKLLTQAGFDKGLRAGVPASIPVAHKFGERALANPLNQLHDCGIIYYPKHPYLLCVMTRGTSMDAQASTIADISRSVYSQIRLRFGDNE